MKIDIDSYAVNKEPILFWYKNQGYKNPEDAVAIISVAYGVPCIVSAYYIGELLEYPEFIDSQINRLIQFYGYTNIENRPIGSSDPFKI